MRGWRDDPELGGIPYRMPSFEEAKVELEKINGPTGVCPREIRGRRCDFCEYIRRLRVIVAEGEKNAGRIA